MGRLKGKEIEGSYRSIIANICGARRMDYRVPFSSYHFSYFDLCRPFSRNHLGLGRRHDFAMATLRLRPVGRAVGLADGSADEHLLLLLHGPMYIVFFGFDTIMDIRFCVYDANEFYIPLRPLHRLLPHYRVLLVHPSSSSSTTSSATETRSSSTEG